MNAYVFVTNLGCNVTDMVIITIDNTVLFYSVFIKWNILMAT